MVVWVGRRRGCGLVGWRTRHLELELELGQLLVEAGDPCVESLFSGDGGRGSQLELILQPLNLLRSGGQFALYLLIGGVQLFLGDLTLIKLRLVPVELAIKRAFSLIPRTLSRLKDLAQTLSFVLFYHQILSQCLHILTHLKSISITIMPNAQVFSHKHANSHRYTATKPMNTYSL